MARAGRKDRGLLAKKDSTGKQVWHVRLYHEGKERRFGSFKNKTEARDFYEKAKQEQKQGRFFPERYHHGAHVLVEELLSRHAETTTVKNQAAEHHYMAWWIERLKGLRLNHVNAAVIEDAQRVLLAQNPPRKRCSIISSRSGMCSTKPCGMDSSTAIPLPACRWSRCKMARLGFSLPKKKPVYWRSWAPSMGHGRAWPFSRDSDWANRSGYDGRTWISIAA